MKNRDVELLSEYLDGMLEPVVLARIESRLEKDAQLRSLLENVRSARDLLHRLPTRKAPRDFRLTRTMVAKNPPKPLAYTGFRYAAVTASLFFVCTLAANSIAFRFGGIAAAPMPARELGSGGGGPETFAQEAPAATLAPVAPPNLGSAPLPTTTAIEEEDALNVPPAEFKSSAPETAPAEESARSIPSWWLVLFGAVALICSLIAFILNRSAFAHWRN